MQFACVAQLVEQRIRNAQVAGSSPAASSKKPVISKEITGFLLFSNKLSESLTVSPRVAIMLLLLAIMELVW